LFREHPASEVYVTGTFDNWSKSEKLVKTGDVFEKDVTLSNVGEKIYYKVCQTNTSSLLLDGSFRGFVVRACGKQVMRIINCNFLSYFKDHQAFEFSNGVVHSPNMVWGKAGLLCSTQNPATELEVLPGELISCANALQLL
jgi:hypothetical protein